MPKRDDDLFQRLRLAGIRKPVAQALAELTDDAGKKAVGAGHKAVAELRALIEEIEKRLPLAKLVSQSHDEPKPVTAAPRRVARSVTKPARAKAAAASAPEKKAPVTRARKSATSAAAKAAPKPAARSTAKASSPAPRGANKAKILQALNGGPRTASEISDETGIATTTVSSALNRLSKTGEVTKASRGYALPR
jgi:hypothetical protein